MYPLTTPQKNIWNLQKFYSDSSISNVSGMLTFDRQLDTNNLERAVNLFVKEQSGIRLRFIEKGKDVCQYVTDYEYINIPVISFGSINEARDYFLSDSQLQFCLTDSPMYRFYIFVTPEQSGVYPCFSHLISDAWTLSIFCRRVMESYSIICNGQDIIENSISYLDYVQNEENYMNSQKYINDHEYWEKRFNSKPELSKIKPCCDESRTARANRFTRILDKNKSANLKKWCMDNNCSIAVLFEAVLFIYLHRINEQANETIIGIPVLNRSTRHEKEIAGMFISTMPLGVNVEESDTVISLCDKISSAHREIFRHQKFPYSEILQIIREKHDFYGNLYDVMVSYQNAHVDSHTDIYYSTEWLHNGYSEIPLALHIDDRDDSAALTVNMDYQIDIFSSQEAKLLFDRILYILYQITANNLLPVSEISLVTKAEYDMVIYDFNDTNIEYQMGKCVHELFTEQVKRTPNAIALVFEDKQFTYKQLDEMSNSLAHFLREKGIKPNNIVPIITKRSWHIDVAMIAVFKAGGAYMPIDPNYPIERIQYMIDEADSKFALTYGFNTPINVEAVTLEDFDFEINFSPIENVNSPEDICYVIFTSGSTGKPKGVMLKHSGLTNFANSKDEFHKTKSNSCSNILAIGAFTFDISVEEIFQSLLNGDCTVIADEDTVNSSESMAEVMIKNKIDLLHTTPTRLEYYLDNKKFREATSNLKVILSAGEAFSTELFNKIRSCTEAEIYNGYGPTETTVGCSFVKVTKPNEITIGKPISNVQMYILDRNNKPCPIGVAGELCIAGAGVGKGYLKRPKLTAEKFVSNPFIAGGRMYRSGDLARWRVDGEIEYLGRIDTQVKIRGLRIELGEIENVMCSFTGIKMSAAADKRDSNGRQYLVGYYTSDEYIDKKQLREFLSSKLPKYMVPNYFLKLDEIPMTISGKTDRKALPVPTTTANNSEYVEPHNDIEKVLCDIVAELLNYEKVSINDDFFELGGDSLKAIEYTAEASDKGIVFDLQSVFEHSTIAELSKYISEKFGLSTKYYETDFEKFSDILAMNSNAIDFVPEYTSLGNIMITGVTGYLGAHILDAFMRYETGKIYCLVRNNSSDDRRGRWPQMLNYYFGDKYNNEIGKRIIPIVGDITDENLVNILPNDVQTVIHAAATVKHFGEYSHFYSVNVKGTENILEFAKRQRSKFIFISTVSVSGNNLTEKGTRTEIFRESDLFIGQDLSNVYIRSKFEAERLVLEAKIDGFDCKIFRVGNLTNRYSDGVFQPNYKENAFLRRIKTFIDLRSYPLEIADSCVDLSPVDLTADAIVKLAEYTGEQYTVFHVNDPKLTTYGHLMEMINCSKYNVSAVNSKDFVRLISSDKDTAYSSVKNDLNEMKALSEYVKVQSYSSFTETILSKIGFEWCEITQKYVDMYVEYFNSLGYWNKNGGRI